ncbi:MAG: DUF456 domain-containing protein [Haloferacaceae archaeon]
MTEFALLVAVALLAAGIVGSVVPMLPSGLFSLAGVTVYWLYGSEPIGPVLLFSLVSVALLAVVVEQFGGAIAAKATGASNRTTIAAVVAGLVLFFVAGPVGIVLGIVGVVFLAELLEDAPPEVALRRAIYTLGGILASTGVQLLLTLSVLAGFVVFVILL